MGFLLGKKKGKKSRKIKAQAELDWLDFDDEDEYEAYESDEDYEDDEDYDPDEDYEDEEDYDSDEDYEDDEDYDSDDEPRGVRKIASFFMNMGVVDHIIMFTGLIVLVLVGFTGFMYLDAKMSEKQIATFAEVGVG